MEGAFRVFEVLIINLGKLIWVILRLILFIIMSAFVIPAMIINVLLHAHWEKMLDEFVTLKRT